MPPNQPKKTTPQKKPTTPPPTHPTNHQHRRNQLWATLAGLTIATITLKTANPPILNHLVTWPQTLPQWILHAWPNQIAYALLAALTLTAIPTLRLRTTAPHWILTLPLLWLLWQLLAATQTINPQLTQPTLAHYTACTLLFYLGHFALNQQPQLQGFRPPLLIALTLALLSGLDQHFGGLEQTRQLIYQQPDWQNHPPELLQRIAKNRIFSTYFYPNTFAGAILFFTPLAAHTLWQTAKKHLQTPSAITLLLTLLLPALLCLYWTQSKTAWLILTLLTITYTLQTKTPKKTKTILLILLPLTALTTFALTHKTYFQQGATSLTARLHYWQAAYQTTQQNPLLGTGPGTFQNAYAKIKPPHAEPTRLTHNDYLQQASDTGLPGALLYTTTILATLWHTRKKQPNNPTHKTTWYACLTFALQSLLEFNLHIPALAWPFFLLLGWLLAQPNQKPNQPKPTPNQPQTTNQLTTNQLTTNPNQP